jgi:hypothetical protein
MVDYSSIYRKEIRKQNLFTFEEVTVILKPMLGDLSLFSFMQMKGHLETNGFLNDYRRNSRMLKILYFESGGVEKYQLDPVIFFTKAGVKVISTQALNYYLSIKEKINAQNIIKEDIIKQNGNNEDCIKENCFAFAF